MPSIGHFAAWETRRPLIEIEKNKQKEKEEEKAAAEEEEEEKSKKKKEVNRLHLECKSNNESVWRAATVEPKWKNSKKNEKFH